MLNVIQMHIATADAVPLNTHAHTHIYIHARGESIDILATRP
jgi:hypothetical protein